MDPSKRKALKATHCSRLLEILERRMQIAEGKGDTALLSQLRAEANYLKPQRGPKMWLEHQLSWVFGPRAQRQDRRFSL